MAPTNKRPRAEDAAEDPIDAALEEVNDILQDDERSQKETWQIGKRLKRLMDEHPTMSDKQTVDALFLWGTALARLASQNDDATLAEAAADKFQEMHTLTQGDDAAMGPVGYSLWASSLLIVATEQQDREVLDRALAKFQQAVDVDGGTSFETRFQYARALKEGADLVKFLEAEAAAKDGTGQPSTTDHREYYRRALTLCGELEKIYEDVSAKAAQDNGDEPNDDGTNESNAEEEDEGDEENDVDPDDDTVQTEDLAEVKLLEAIVHGLLEEDDEEAASDPVTAFERTFGLFKAALALSPENPGVLMEMANYVAKKGTARRTIRRLDLVDWDAVFAFLEAQYKVVLGRVDFDLGTECHVLCVRKDTIADEELAYEELLEAQAQHLLHALGRALVGLLIGDAAAATDTTKPSKMTLGEMRRLRAAKARAQAARGTEHPRYQHTIEVLRSAHHFHDKLGCYPLACLFATPAYLDEEQCRAWLETADSYGALEDELDLADFAAVRDKPWFEKYTRPVEVVDVETEADNGDGNPHATDEET